MYFPSPWWLLPNHEMSAGAGSLVSKYYIMEADLASLSASQISRICCGTVIFLSVEECAMPVECSQDRFDR